MKSLYVSIVALCINIGCLAYNVHTYHRIQQMNERTLTTGERPGLSCPEPLRMGVVTTEDLEYAMKQPKEYWNDVPQGYPFKLCDFPKLTPAKNEVQIPDILGLKYKKGVNAAGLWVSSEENPNSYGGLYYLANGPELSMCNGKTKKAIDAANLALSIDLDGDPILQIVGKDMKIRHINLREMAELLEKLPKKK